MDNRGKDLCRKVCGNVRDGKDYADDLYSRLLTYTEGTSVPFHMPGHKRRFHLVSDPYAVDITEIEGFDNLHHAEGILMDAQKRAASLYGSAAAFYLVNGSTAGLLAAICAVCRRGDRILAARNCHKAVYHAIWMRGLDAFWMYPQMDAASGICGSILPEDVERELSAHPEVRAVILTSPTYDGICSDIREIARVVHRHGAVLIVDEAHGAHYGLHPFLPQSAVTLGADAVIQSMHKTLPALTQTALLHICSSRIAPDRVRKFLEVFQTSSPSYVLMASMDRCICMLEKEGQELYETYVRNLAAARARLERLKYLHLVNGKEKERFCFAYDPTRIVITLLQRTRNVSPGRTLSGLLRTRWNIEAEMEAEQYVVFLTSVGDTADSFERLCEALETIDQELEEAAGASTQPDEKPREAPAGASALQDEKPREAPAGASAQPDEKPREAPGGASALQDEKPREASADDSGAPDERLPAVVRFPAGEPVLRMDEAEEEESETVFLSASEGRISGDTVYLYPPGIPLLIPGERIPAQLLELLERYRKKGFSLQGMADPKGDRILVLKMTDKKQTGN